MKFRVEAKWPSSDILPEAKDAATASTALKACAAFLRAGCRISRIERTYADGRVSTMRVAELLRLARAEGCGIRFPPRPGLRVHRSVAGVLFAILCSALPNAFGDFATLMEMTVHRVAIRRSEGARSKTVRRPDRAYTADHGSKAAAPPKDPTDG